MFLSRVNECIIVESHQKKMKIVSIYLHKLNKTKNQSLKIRRKKK